MPRISSRGSPLAWRWRRARSVAGETGTLVPSARTTSFTRNVGVDPLVNAPATTPPSRMTTARPRTMRAGVRTDIGSYAGGGSTASATAGSDVVTIPPCYRRGSGPPRQPLHRGPGIRCAGATSWVTGGMAPVSQATVSGWSATNGIHHPRSATGKGMNRVPRPSPVTSAPRGWTGRGDEVGRPGAPVAPEGGPLPPPLFVVASDQLQQTAESRTIVQPSWDGTLRRKAVEHMDTDGGVDEATEPGRGLSRRNMIAAAAAVLAGSVAVDALASSEAGAASGSPLLLGEGNTASDPTGLTGPSGYLPALEVVNPGNSGGVAGAANAGLIGSVGPGGALTGAPITSGVVGWSSLYPGAYGALGTGLTGATQSTSYGVVGFNDVAGVTGAASTGAGVFGVVGVGYGAELGLTTTTLPAGVQGYGGTPGSVGVSAINNQNGLALQVQGAADFSTSGHGSIPAGAASVIIADPGVTASSRILATPSASPGKGQEFWVTSVPGAGFVVHRTKSATTAVPFSYFRIG